VAAALLLAAEIINTSLPDKIEKVKPFLYKNVYFFRNIFYSIFETTVL